VKGWRKLSFWLLVSSFWLTASGWAPAASWAPGEKAPPNTVLAGPATGLNNGIVNPRKIEEADLNFSPAIAVGEIGDHCIVRGGTPHGGNGVQSSGVSITDTNNMNGVQALTAQAVYADSGHFDGSLYCGTNGSLGSFSLYPSGENKGHVEISTGDNAGATVTSLLIAGQAGARTYTVPDAGGSATFAFTSSSITGTAAGLSSTLAVTSGGTGQSSWTQYLIPYANTTTSFSQIPIGTAGQVLISNGAGAAASFQTPSYMTNPGTCQGYLFASAPWQINWGPFKGGNQIALYNGAAWTTVTITGIYQSFTTDRSNYTGTGDGGHVFTLTSYWGVWCVGLVSPNWGTITAVSDNGSQITVSGTATAGVQVMNFALPASGVADVFAYLQGGSPKIEFCPWTSTTMRAVTLTTQDGVYVKTGALTRRYLGTIAVDDSSYVLDNVACRWVWNYYNRTPAPMCVNDTTATWTYTTAAWRIARNNSANQLSVVVGVVEDPLTVHVGVTASASSTSQFGVCVGVNGAQGVQGFTTFANGAGSNVPCISSWTGLPRGGLNSFAWWEFSTAVGTTTWKSWASGTDSGGISAIVWR
jgi:hypothetical protein